MYTFDPTIHRYRDDNGNVVSVEEVRKIIFNIVDAAKVDLSDLALQYLNGTITADQWHTQASAVITYNVQIASVIARGGNQQMTPDDQKLVDSVVKEQIDYLTKFVADTEAKVTAGQPPSRQQLINRSQMYAGSAWSSSMSLERRVMRLRGYDLERRLLYRGGVDGRSCQRCRDLAMLGWQQSGTLPDVGHDTPCLHNCRCSFSYAKSSAMRAGAGTEAVPIAAEATA